MKIGIYGGTFNPPHLGHLSAARFAMEALGLEKLLLIPAAIPPHKSLPGGSPTVEQRLELVTLAADGMLLPEQVAVSDLELRRGGKSFTADTLAQVHAQYPGATLYLLMGTDMFLTLQDWHQPQQVMALAEIVVFGRAQAPCHGAVEAQRASLQRTYGARVTWLQLPQITEVSSTDLRALLAAGQGSDALPPAVYGCILRCGLYGTHANLAKLSDDDLRSVSYSMMRAKRLAHVRGTEQEAVRLAEHWGGDVEKARRAAILHDCTKYWTLEQHVALCQQAGVALDDLECTAVKLLHSKTGAILARTQFGQGQEIYNAIFWHTTGKAEMTLLEKILYLADYMEPTRDFPGVEALRALAYQDLNQALLLGFEMSVREMEERGLPVHHRTVEARDWLKGTRHESK